MAVQVIRVMQDGSEAQNNNKLLHDISCNFVKIVLAKASHGVEVKRAYVGRE